MCFLILKKTVVRFKSVRFVCDEALKLCYCYQEKKLFNGIITEQCTILAFKLSSRVLL